MELEARAAMFSMVDGVMLRPVPFKGAGRLCTLSERNAKMGYKQNPPAAAAGVEVSLQSSLGG